MPALYRPRGSRAAVTAPRVEFGGLVHTARSIRDGPYDMPVDLTTLQRISLGGPRYVDMTCGRGVILDPEDIPEALDYPTVTCLRCVRSNLQGAR